MISNKSAFLWTAPYSLCWISIPIIILIGLLFGRQTLDWQLYDTYYVITVRQYAIALAVLIWSFGVIYWTMYKTGKKPNYTLSLLHIGTTIAISTIVTVQLSGIAGPSINPFTLFGVFVAAQIAFLANVLMSVLKK